MQAVTEWMKNDYVTELLEALTSYIQEKRALVISGTSMVTFLMWWYRRPSHFPPGPRGVPGLGVVPYLDPMAARSFALWGRKYNKKSGGIMSVRMGGNDLIIINKAETVRKIFSSKEMKGRPAIELLYQLSKGNGIFFVDDNPDLWKQRKFMGNVLRKLGMGKSELDEKVIDEVEMLNKKIESYNGKPFDILYLLTNAVSNNACLVSLGMRFDYENETFQNLLHKFCHAFYDKKASAAILACLCYGPLAYLPGFSNHVKDIINDTKYCLDIITSIIKKKQENFDNYDNPQDFVEYFTCEQRKSEPTFTDTQLLMSVKDMLFGGTITTTSTIRWILMTLIKHPNYQERCYQEIEDVFGEGRIAYNRKNETPFTLSFIYEVMRYHTTVPLGVPHSSPIDVKFNGYVIPKGTPVYANIYACHHDPHEWSQPEQFLPERHLSTKTGEIEHPTASFFPFSIGQRRCIGEALALSEIYIFTASIIRRFKLSTDDVTKLPHDNEASLGLLNIPAPFKIIAQSR